MFDFKELYELKLKATYNIEINGNTIEAGETVAVFDNIQVAGFNEVKNVVTAHGGYGDKDHVFWDTTKRINLNFTQGVFSKDTFALLNNSKVLKSTTEDPILISKIEQKESNSRGEFTLSKEPYQDKVFVRNGDTWQKITATKVANKTWKIPTSYQDVVIDYSYVYNKNATIFRYGDKLLNGYLELEAKTRVKDDKSGQVVTGIIKIPKLKLVSGLSLKLGQNATPIAGNFQAIAEPVDSGVNSYAMEFILLENDIDSDM